ncbi:hypothetical protein KC19_2G225300 [Ceratodon purpureus]|uniref:Legume lectin domain-containing protein n=1 Tax=Ceratodon purpureus TaxID=3225 RepID=A0A8T0IZ87_CERPU|nr:hypothetical protein KC19_2G225300 [Ceratodon purpureus]KAG0588210.1 hypothetical protein KC19_2G225300 [Ceratodon purpureus]
MAVARRSFGLLVAVLMTFSQSSLGFKFAFNGFKSQSELFIVTESNWEYNLVNESCYTLVWPPDRSVGRLLYPQAVSMRELGSSAVMSFSTTFIFQIYQHPAYVGKGSGFTFLMVPNNSTIGAPNDFLGLITTTTDTVAKDVASDEQTFGVEFDTYQNPEFNDENDNHIGLDFASMNSTVSFKPVIPLVTESETVYHQVWIDYSQNQSTMDIYLAVYQAWVVKPAVPSVSWPNVDLSLLSEPTFVGFSAAIGTTGADRHSIFAWSFSNEGEAPPISLAKDAPPSGPSPAPLVG